MRPRRSSLSANPHPNRYVKVMTIEYPDGEIRGQILPIRSDAQSKR